LTETAAPPARPHRGAQPKPDLRVRLAGIPLTNPVIAASGTFGYGIEFEDIVSLEKLGGFVVKGLSREPMAGNPPPRLFETAAGMLNSIGLQNIGAEAFIKEKLPHLRLIIYDDPLGVRHYRYPFLKSFEDIEASGRDFGSKNPGFIEREIDASSRVRFSNRPRPCISWM